jgi:hypothetical protein
VLQGHSIQAHYALQTAAQAEIAKKEIVQAATFSFALRIALGKRCYETVLPRGQNERPPRHAQTTYSVALAVVYFGLSQI